MCSNTLSSLAAFDDFLTTHKPTVAMEMLPADSLSNKQQVFKMHNKQPHGHLHYQLFNMVRYI